MASQNISWAITVKLYITSIEYVFIIFDLIYIACVQPFHLRNMNHIVPMNIFLFLFINNKQLGYFDNHPAIIIQRE